MKFQLEVNSELLEQEFTSEEELKAFLLKWNRDHAFEVEDLFLSVDQFFDMLKDEMMVSCYSPFMCEMGDDHVDIELVIVSE